MPLYSSTDNVLAMVLAGGQGERMRPLTSRRAKPALPFAGVYKLIDFPLSNLVHSRVRDVWVVEQFEPHELNDHLLNGRPWDLDRNRGGLRVFAPHTKSDADDAQALHQGNADALYRNARAIAEFDPELLIVCSADHIYKLDLRPVLGAHRDTKAEVTLVTTEVPDESANRYGTLKADGSGRVTFWDYKPESPQSGTVATEVFVYSTRVLLEVLEQLASSGGLQDFGHELLPELVRRGRAYSFPLDGYWRDVGTHESYWQGHMDLLGDSPLHLDDAQWPILTSGTLRVPARVARGATVEDSLLSPGCTVEGEVINSVLCPGAVIERGASVRDCVLLEGARVRSGAHVSRAILDKNASVSESRGGDEVVVLSNEKAE